MVNLLAEAKYSCKEFLCEIIFSRKYKYFRSKFSELKKKKPFSIAKLQRCTIVSTPLILSSQKHNSLERKQLNINAGNRGGNPYNIM